MAMQELPPRIFAAGDEPTGERVNSYHKAKTIGNIMDALDEGERNYLRSSPFGKLIATAEKPSLSGSFGHYIITRLLKVNKKHEIWIWFAGRPIGISLREFAIVTGLPCGRYPKRLKKKKRNPIKEKPYWPDLFGNLKVCSVDLATKMLKKRTVADRTTRLKYACLAVTGAVLCPTNHRSKIVFDHVELIRDLDEFFLYPWGRLGFEMLIASIKTKDEVALAQSTVAVKGFFQAIHLILVEAIPALTEVVQVNESSDSSGSEDGEDEEVDIDDTVESGGGVEGNLDPEPVMDTDRIAPKTNPRSEVHKLGLSPGHAREIDEECKADVFSIIPDDPNVSTENMELDWSDDEEDPTVDYVVQLIGESFQFRKEMFKGGMTQAELVKMRSERKEVNKKKEKEKLMDSVSGMHTSDKGSGGSTSHPVDKTCSLVKEQLADIQGSLSEALLKISALDQVVSGFEENLKTSLDVKLKEMQEELVSNILGLLDKSLSASGKQSVGKQRSDCGQGGNTANTKTAPRALSATIPRVNDDLNPNVVIADAIGMVNALPGSRDGHQGEDLPTAKGNSQEGTVMASKGTNASGSEVGDSNDVPPTNPGGKDDHDTGCDVDGGNDFDDDVTDFNVAPRRGKRPRIQNTTFTDYQVDTRLLASSMGSNHFLCPLEQQRIYFEKFARLLSTVKSLRVISLGDGSSVTAKDVVEIGKRTKPMLAKMMNALLLYARAVYNRLYPEPSHNKTEFMETKFVAHLMKCWGKFKNLAPKDRPKFVIGDAVMEYLEPETPKQPPPERLYLPFNVDKEHWIAVYVDVLGGSILAIDCNTSLRMEAAVKKEITHLAQMLPYVLKRLTGYKRPINCKVFSMQRAKGIPQNPIRTDSGVSAALFAMLHCIGGVERCKLMTPEELVNASQVLAVKFFEEFAEEL
ncbi:uncharacterized protein LOC112082022 [Eutrema salsugineum]|uniref:uncharacterized protein LOC112082022 n=1 Tax=Eutrema salsugineum TaxID=72664 RepID=UPI000CED1EC4|nr:uncharacterized protein LOC112082022 [Eutrema salsugineum]